MYVMDIVNLYEKYFNANVKAIFEHCSKIASESNVRIYIIGGLVRDLLLNQKSLDIDITVEGDAIRFARKLENLKIAEIKSIHKDFGTVKIIIDGVDIDLASTRNEIYPQKGQLPVVTEIGCKLREDIARRDFTINSLALSLNQDDFLRIIDYVDGLTDLKNKKLKLLHSNSFIDDPTRIIRGLKYANRLGFELEPETKRLQEEYLDNIDYNMGYKRVLQEFKKTFSAENPPYQEFINQGIYKLINANHCELYPIKNEDLPWIVYFGLIAPDVITEFELTKEETQILEGTKCLEKKILSSDFEIYKAFCASPKEVAQILAIKQNLYAKKYLDSLSKIKLETTGKDLINMGLKPSKKFGEIFDFILKEKLNNPTLTKDQELKLVKDNF